MPATDDSTIIMVRHIPSKLNATGVSRSWLRVPPDPEELERLGPGIAKVLKGLNVSKIRSSDLPRASKTADYLADLMDLPTPEHTFDLRTWQTGVGGKKEAETLATRQKYIKYPDEKPPGGETVNDAMNRTGPEFQKAAKYNGQHPDEPMAFVNHGHHFIFAPTFFNGEDPDPKALSTLDEDYPPGSVSLLHVRGGKAEMERIYPSPDKNKRSNNGNNTPGSTSEKS